MTQRIALLIDGDNLQADHVRTMQEAAASKGRLDVVRVYAGDTLSAKWLNTPGVRHMYAGGGKNAADILMCIDAMELALQDGIEAFAIASSDKDLTHLAQRLREKGNYVLGLGDSRAAPCFQSACHDFQSLGERRITEELDKKIRNVIAANSRNGEGIKITDLSRLMRQKHDTKISTRPEGKWWGYLAAWPTLYELDPRGPDAKVRFLANGFQ